MDGFVDCGLHFILPVCMRPFGKALSKLCPSAKRMDVWPCQSVLHDQCNKHFKSEQEYMFAILVLEILLSVLLLQLYRQSLFVKAAKDFALSPNGSRIGKKKNESTAKLKIKQCIIDRMVVIFSRIRFSDSVLGFFSSHLLLILSSARQ